jgi:glycerol-3-phosphate dehydrogenase (NAD(P)+)
VLGAGLWGATFAVLAGNSGIPVRLWSRDSAKREVLRQTRALPGASAPLPDSVSIVDSLDEALEEGRVLLAVPPGVARSLLARAAPFFRPDHLVVHVARGLEGEGTPLSQVIEEETCVLRVGALAGPVVPAALGAGIGTVAVVGSRYQQVVRETAELLATSRVRVYGTLDIVGVEVGGAMRTPMALAAGLVRGLGLGPPLMAVLLTRGIAEAGRLAESLGGDRATVSGLSGIGDWMLTAQDDSDDVVRAGLRLARGESAAHPEAESRVKTLLAIGSSRQVDLPITAAVGAVLEGLAPAEALDGLMARAAGGETD